MRTLKLAAAGLALAALVPAAASGGQATRTDKANAARTCAQLRTSLGAATFARTYGAATGVSRANAFGRCVAAMTREAHAARHAAERACARTAKGKGKGLARVRAACVTAQTRQALRQELDATKNAAHFCKAERQRLGEAMFASTYGTNPNDRNAFGKCVSQKARADNQGGAGSQAGTRLQANLTGTTGSGKFSATIDLAQSRLCYTLTVKGLTGVTAAHIHTAIAQTIDGVAYQTGAVVVPLAAPTTGSYSACITVDPDILAAIVANNANFYVNVHTSAAPAGAVKGDLK